VTSTTPDPAVARLAAARAALAALGNRDSCECSVVELRIDGSRFAVRFDLDRHEHRRRQQVGAGAATHTGLLHALWELPAHVPVPATCLDDLDLSTLRELGAGYVEGTEMLTRTFAPAATVTAVVVVAKGMNEALARASRLPPIFWRLAASSRRPARFDMAIAAGHASGVGGVVVGGDGTEVVVAPRSPIRGVPAVYRWWLGELAYRNWGSGNCAHCFS
jgi:hypothetical protein